MRNLLLLIILTTSTLLPLSSEAERRYKVYKTNEFGRKSVLSQPEAIIEENSLFGEWRVYESTPFGQPDTLKGPIYIIEKDSLFSSSSRPWEVDDVLEQYSREQEHHDSEHSHHHGVEEDW